MLCRNPAHVPSSSYGQSPPESKARIIQAALKRHVERPGETAPRWHILKPTLWRKTKHLSIQPPERTAA